MAKPRNIKKLTHSELIDLRSRVDRLLVDKQAEEKNMLRQRLADMAKAEGYSLEELLGKGRKGKGSVPVKYRDPSNPANTWTGRGRMPRWLVAATRGRKATKEDFLV
jgi:DNA-binding protein H-NS